MIQSDQDMKNALSDMSLEIKKIENDVKKLIIGRAVQVITKNNLQPYNDSGELIPDDFIIKDATIDSSGVYIWGGEFHFDAISIERVEFIF
jgi:hypothetical protein